MSEQEFTERVLVYSSKFCGYSFKILGNHEEARDVVQDLYVKLWGLKDTLGHVNNIEAYATTIIRNLCIDRLKRHKNTNIHIDEFQRQVIQHESSSVESNYIEQEEKLALVRDTLKKLPDTQKKVFIMRDIEEIEFDLISVELGITPENVRVVLSRARKKIRELIEKNK